MGQGVRTGLGHGGITCVLQTQFFSLVLIVKKKRANKLETVKLLLLLKKTKENYK